jgi:tetratricopeptide (TPR) repeat protein
MRTKPYIITTLAVLLLGAEVAVAQTQPLPPPEIQSSPLPSPEPPPLLPAQQETVRQLIEKEIKDSQSIADRVRDEVNDTFGWTLNLLNLLITVLIAVPIGTGFVLWWLRQSVIDRLVKDIRVQFQSESERLIKRELEQEVTVRLQQQVADFEQELQKLRADFEQRLDSLYLDAEVNKDNIVQELGRILATVGQEDAIPFSIERRLKELTDQLEAIKAGRGSASFSVSDYLKEGDAFYLGRNFGSAVASFKAALALDPDSIESWLGLAKTLRRMGRYQEAIEANEEIIHRQQQNAWGWFGKGYALSDLQQYESALSAYEMATQLNPNRSTFWKNKGYVLTKLQRYDEALDCFDKALYLKPQSAGATYWKAYCYAAQHQIDQAIEHLKTAMQYRPDYREQLKTDPDFEAIRHTEIFQQLFSDVG